MESICRILYDTASVNEQALVEYRRIIELTYPECNPDDVMFSMTPDKLHEVIIRVKLCDCGTMIVRSTRLTIVCRELEQFVIQARKDGRNDRLCAVLSAKTAESKPSAELPTEPATELPTESAAELSTTVPIKSSVESGISPDEQSVEPPVDLSNCKTATEFAHAIGKYDEIHAWCKKESFAGLCSSPYFAAHGQLDLLKQSIKLANASNVWVAGYAAVNRHLCVLEWLESTDIEKNTTAQKMAAKYGHLDMLKWLDEHGYPRSGGAFSFAVSEGHTHILNWMIDNSYTAWTDASIIAAGAGRIEFLKLLQSRGLCIVSADTFIAAAKQGHIDVIEWLILTGYLPRDAMITAVAAANGQIDVLKLLVGHGCTVDERVCEKSAEYGWINVFKYAIKNDFPRGRSAELCSHEFRKWLANYDKYCA